MTIRRRAERDDSVHEEIYRYIVRQNDHAAHIEIAWRNDRSIILDFVMHQPGDTEECEFIGQPCEIRTIDMWRLPDGPRAKMLAFIKRGVERSEEFWHILEECVTSHTRRIN